MDMHCPICNAVNAMPNGIQIQCRSCKCWSHRDNWTYTDAEWEKIQAANKARYPASAFPND